MKIRLTHNGKTIDVRVIPGKRKTFSLEIHPDSSMVLRCPMTTDEAVARHFLETKQEWIALHLQKMYERQEALSHMPPITEATIARLTASAKQVFPLLVREIALQMGVTYGKVSIRHQRTRWGSCSAQGNLNFNCLLMQAPEEVRRYVVTHELAHRREMNHSARFWQIVATYCPAYPTAKQWLDTQGVLLMTQLDRQI